MTPQQAFEEISGKIEALDAATVRPPVYKVEARVVEGQRLFGAAMPQEAAFEKLASLGLFDMLNLTKLEVAALALRHAEAGWLVLRNPARDESFQAKLRQVEEARSSLLRNFGYVAAKFSPEGLARALGAVREGSSRQDTLQDVETLCTLAKRHEKVLSTIGFSFGLVDEAS
jgi:hypothetical protein